VQRFLNYLFVQAFGGSVQINKFKKRCYLVGCSLKLYYDALTYEYQMLKILMRGLPACTGTFILSDSALWSHPVSSSNVQNFDLQCTTCLLHFFCMLKRNIFRPLPLIRLGIESRWGRDFLHLSRPALGPTQPPVQWVSGVCRG
jgi:hypothetical protein